MVTGQRSSRIPVPQLGDGEAAARPAVCSGDGRSWRDFVARSFYDSCLQAGTGPLVNPFPLARARRAHAHHNPMDRFAGQRAGLFRPGRSGSRGRFRTASSMSCSPPCVRTGPGTAGVLDLHRRRAHRELLGALAGGIDPGQQLVTVVRKGSRAVQQLPASPDAFVWLRLYQQQMHGLVPAGPADPVWWTLRRPFRPWLTRRPGRCSAGPTRFWGPTGRSMTCGIRRPTG